MPDMPTLIRTRKRAQHRHCFNHVLDSVVFPPSNAPSRTFFSYPGVRCHASRVFLVMFSLQHPRVGQRKLARVRSYQTDFRDSATHGIRVLSVFWHCLSKHHTMYVRPPDHTIQYLPCLISSAGPQQKRSSTAEH